MVAGQGAQEQPRKLFPDRMPEACVTGRLIVVLEAGAVVKDPRQRTGLRLGGVHGPNIGPRDRSADPSPE